MSQPVEKLPNVDGKLTDHLRQAVTHLRPSAQVARSSTSRHSQHDTRSNPRPRARDSFSVGAVACRCGGRAACRFAPSDDPRGEPRSFPLHEYAEREAPGSRRQACTYEVLRRATWRAGPSRVGSTPPLGSTAGSRSPQVSSAVTASIETKISPRVVCPSPVIVMQSPPEATCNQRKAAVVG
jgi:hypothetical protein